ncbi:MAG: radical SAM protein [Deltaproteobacteria bacterium]|nr:radical SAM protein [Deltaproteobacteria bacterium]
MARKKQLIIPIFIPFGGCPHRCVFCNQEDITGSSALPAEKDVLETVEKYLSTWRGGGRTEIAFYGGSFTGLERGVQEGYLQIAYGFVRSGRVWGVRISTRPDYISPETIGFLKRCGVKTVELGVQSFSDEVLRASARGHSSKDTVEAVEILKNAGLRVGMQLMPGLPGDTEGSIVETAKKTVELRPDFVRIYPTLVIRDTPLYRMYLEKRYIPWELEDMVRVCNIIYGIFVEAGIAVARVGLRPSEALQRSVAAGPYHPSFRQLLPAASCGPVVPPIPR